MLWFSPQEIFGSDVKAFYFLLNTLNVSLRLTEISRAVAVSSGTGGFPPLKGVLGLSVVESEDQHTQTTFYHSLWRCGSAGEPFLAYSGCWIPSQLTARVEGHMEVK